MGVNNYIGSNKVNNVYVGTSLVDKKYVGSTLTYLRPSLKITTQSLALEVLKSEMPMMAGFIFDREEYDSYIFNTSGGFNIFWVFKVSHNVYMDSPTEPTPCKTSAEAIDRVKFYIQHTEKDNPNNYNYDQDYEDTSDWYVTVVAKDESGMLPYVVNKSNGIVSVF